MYRYRTAYKVWESLCAKSNILLRLHNPVPVTTDFSLHRHNKLAAATIYANIKLINLDLSDTFDIGSVMFQKDFSMSAA